MNTITKKQLLTFIIGIIILGGVGVLLSNIGSTSNEKEVVYACTGDKSIIAIYNNDAKTVKLSLSDKREFTLTQGMSASGVRYTDEKEQFVFWTKGPSSFFEEKGSTTFSDCIEGTPSASTTENTSNEVKKPSTSTKSTIVIPPNYQTYSNATQKFAISYPKGVIPENSFKSYYFLQTEWRALASSEKRGTPVVAFPIFRVDNQNKQPKDRAYPLYYAAEVRVGVSKDTANCYAKDAGYTDQKVSDVVINGILFKKFAFGEAGMSQYVEGNSYRTIKNGTCYVIEQIKTGSTYRDDQMQPGVTDTALNTYYDVAGAVVKTFRFSN